MATNTVTAMLILQHAMGASETAIREGMIAVERKRWLDEQIELREFEDRIAGVLRGHRTIDHVLAVA